MVTNPAIRFVSWVILVMICEFGFGKAQAVAEALPRVFILQAQNLVEAKKRAQSGDTTVALAFKKLTREAESRAGRRQLFSREQRTCPAQRR
jgi:hypothetical protein